MVKIKPTGKARVILNLSAAKGSCLNEGIDKTNYPAKMTSTMQFVLIMTKQIRVDESDHQLQYIECA